MPSVVTVALMAIYVGINSGYSEIDLYGVDHTFFDSLTVNSKINCAFVIPISMIKIKRN